MPYFMTTSYRSIPDVDEDKYWDENWGSIVRSFIEPIDRGVKIDPKLFPSSGFLEQKTSVIPNLFSIQFWYCTDAIKQAIERLEPGRHYFHPYVLRDAPEGKEIAQLYIINIVDPVDAVDVERSENLDIRMNPSGKQITRVSTVFLSESKREIALHEDMIKDRHLWLSPKAFGPGNAFVSDALHEIILQHDVSPSPLRFYRTK
ncbi:imm11 family protein [Roseibium album]|uniref:imm11 family protein n=1 Tax=Roseibium album TaxID=311410 RepID=UPI003918BC0C